MLKGIPFNDALRPPVYKDPQESKSRLCITYGLVFIAVAGIFCPLLVYRRVHVPLVEQQAEYPSLEEYNTTLKNYLAVRCSCSQELVDPYPLFLLATPANISQALSQSQERVESCRSFVRQLVPVVAAKTSADVAQQTKEDVLHHHGDGLCVRFQSWQARVSLFSSMKLALRSDVLLRPKNLSSILSSSLIAHLLVVSGDYANVLREILEFTSTQDQEVRQKLATGLSEVSDSVTSYTFKGLVRGLTIDSVFTEYYAQCAPIACSYLERESLVDSLLLSVALAAPLILCLFSIAAFLYRYALCIREPESETKPKCSSCRGIKCPTSAAPTVEALPSLNPP